MDIQARRTIGKNARPRDGQPGSGLQWFQSSDLCDTSRDDKGCRPEPDPEPDPAASPEPDFAPGSGPGPTRERPAADAPRLTLRRGVGLFPPAR